MNLIHVNNRRGVLCLSQDRRMGYPACSEKDIVWWVCPGCRTLPASVASLTNMIINLQQDMYRLIELNTKLSTAADDLNLKFYFGFSDGVIVIHTDFNPLPQPPKTKPNIPSLLISSRNVFSTITLTTILSHTFLLMLEMYSHV